jgi:hypothetical protein
MAQIYQSIATEDGVIEGGDENRGVDKKVGDENPDQSPQQQLPSPAHGGSGSTNQRFSPPMRRLGGPKPADGGLEPTAPTPADVPEPPVWERNPENEIVRRETRMSDTAREVLGNSKTAQRLTDDVELNGRDILSQAIDKYRSTPTLLNLGIDAIRAGAERVFGFRDDMAVALARRLFTADPSEQARILAGIEARMGKEKTSKFLEAMSRAALVATTSGAGQVGQGMAISAP